MFVLPLLALRAVADRPPMLIELSLLGERELMLLVLLALRPLIPNRPYPSWPVPATGPLTDIRSGFSAGFFSFPSGFGFLEKNAKRGDFAGEGTDPTAGESLRCDREASLIWVLGTCAAGLEGKRTAVGGGEIAESMRGDVLREDDLDGNPKRPLALEESS